MENDIFLDYIKKKNSKTGLGNNALGTLVSQNENEAITILKEISSKLDTINKAPLYSKDDFAVNSYKPSFLQPTTSNLVDISIINGKVVLPDNGTFETNVHIKNGKVHSLGNNAVINAAKTIDASGLYVIPGLIDPHVHLGLFAPITEELETETKSALVGGITTMGCYFGGNESHLKTFPQITDIINKQSYVDIVSHLVIVTDEQRKEIGDYINHLGITSFKVYMNGIPGLIKDVDDGFILDVFEEIKKSNKKCILCSHAENRDIIKRANRIVKEEKGDVATIQDWTDTHPDIAEEEAVIRLSFLAEKCRIPIYFVHISSKNAIEKLKIIKQTNKYINIETTSPYLSISRNDAIDNKLKMEPPFRDPEDIEALWNAVFDGVIDTIGTDNVTMTKEEKRTDETIWNTMSGYPAVETHLPVMLNEGVIRRGMELDKLIALMTKKPAEIFGVYPQKGTLLPGSDADVVIVDLNKIKEVKASENSSRSDFSLYEGKKLKGWPVITIKSGEIVVENGSYIGKSYGGRYLPR